MDYSPEDVFVGVENGLVDFHLLLVLEIDLLYVVMEADLGGTLKKSSPLLALRQQFAKLDIEESVKLSLGVAFV